MLAITLDLVQILIQWSQALLRKLVRGRTPGQHRSRHQAEPGEAAELEPRSTELGKCGQSSQLKLLGHLVSPQFGLSLLCDSQACWGEAPEGWRAKTLIRDLTRVRCQQRQQRGLEAKTGV